jgi:uncharacterized protein (DUF1499 family)
MADTPDTAPATNAAMDAVATDSATAEVIAPSPAPSPSPARWPGWLGNFVLGGAILAITIAAIGLTLARYDMIDKLSGFIAFMTMMIPAAVIAALSLIGIVLARWKHVPGRKALGGLVLSLGLLGVMYFAVIRPAGAAPALHDITTNVDNPPQFTALALREDNLIPFNSIEEWRAAHREGYPDIAPVLIDSSPTQVLAKARALAETKGWTVANTNPQTLQMEATAYAGYLRFRDDVIVKVTPVLDGTSRVDMRSVSRVGLSDLGYNAARIREFLAELQAS